MCSERQLAYGRLSGRLVTGDQRLGCWREKVARKQRPSRPKRKLPLNSAERTRGAAVPPGSKSSAGTTCKCQPSGSCGGTGSPAGSGVVSRHDETAADLCGLRRSREGPTNRPQLSMCKALPPRRPAKAVVGAGSGAHCSPGFDMAASPPSSPKK